MQLQEPITALPNNLEEFDLTLDGETGDFIYTYSTNGTRTGIATLFSRLNDNGLMIGDVHTSQSSLEDIMIDLLGENT